MIAQYTDVKMTQPANEGDTTRAAAPFGTEPERESWQAIRRGWRRRCPNCGAGPLMNGYLKVRKSCPVCGTQLHHHRADDAPAYLTITIVGFVLGPAMVMLNINMDLDPLIAASILSVIAVALSLFLLPRLKGALIGLQWSKRMHGFRRDDRDDVPLNERHPR